jgi:ribosomal protein S18 acetylase RimI-like enzyme
MTRLAANGPVRQLSPGDEERLLALFHELEASEETMRYFHPHPFDRATASRITSGGGLDLYLGYFLDTELLGYAMLRGWDEGYEVPAFGVAVSPAHRARGVGGALLAACLEEAGERGVRRVMLKVHADNQRALDWYLSAGFVRTGIDEDGQVVCERVLAPA